MLTQEQKQQLVQILNSKRNIFVDQSWSKELDEEQFALFIAGAMKYESFILNELGLPQSEYDQISVEQGFISYEDIKRLSNPESFVDAIIGYVDNRQQGNKEKDPRE
jgi:hypothetical protein